MSDPFFIVGCPRSGTTLLRLCLDSHPNLSVGPETGLLAGFEQALRRNWHTLQNFRWERSYWIAKFSALFESFQREYAESRGKVRWGDKTPGHAMVLPFIRELFPTAKVLHSLRDPFDVVLSARERWGRRQAHQMTAQWSKTIHRCREFAKAHPEQIMDVRYEELVAEPETVLRRVLEFLDEPWSDAVMHHDQAGHDVGEDYWAFSASRRDGQDAIYASRVGRGRRELSLPLRLRVRARIGRLMKEVGYA